MLLLLVPVNLLAVILNNYVMKSMRETIDQSVNSVIQSYITFLENRMATADYLLRHMRSENGSGIAMLREDDEDYYHLYRTRFYWEIQKLIDYTDGMDAYFYIVKDREDVLLWHTDGVKTEKGWVQEDWERGWHLKKVGDGEALCLWAEVREVTYGGWIGLEQAREQLKTVFSYQKNRTKLN